MRNSRVSLHRQIGVTDGQFQVVKAAVFTFLDGDSRGIIPDEEIKDLHPLLQSNQRLFNLIQQIVEREPLSD